LIQLYQKTQLLSIRLMSPNGTKPPLLAVAGVITRQVW
jgi:hypothetical protein